MLGIADTPKGISIPYRDGMGRETYPAGAGHREEEDVSARRAVARHLDAGRHARMAAGLRGESDCMAAISALYEVDDDLRSDPDFADDGPEVLLRRKANLPSL